MQHKTCKNKYLELRSIRSSKLGTKNKKNKTNKRGLNFCPWTKTKKVNCCPIFLGTLWAITVWLLVITTQSRPSKDALSDFIQQNLEPEFDSHCSRCLISVDASSHTLTTTNVQDVWIILLCHWCPWWTLPLRGGGRDFSVFFSLSLIMAAGNDCNWWTECIVCVALDPDQECLS